MWSLGATGYVMLYGRFPYEPEVRTTSNMKNVVARGFPAPQYRPIGVYPQPSRLAERIVRAMLVRNPMKREDATRALESPLGKELRDAALNRTSPDEGGCESISFLPVVLAAQNEIKDEVFQSRKEDPTV